MTIEVRVPTLGESVTEATIASWFKQPGEAVAADEMLCELETDKVTIEVPAPGAGVLGDHVAKEGDTVGVDALLGTIEDGGAAAAPAAPAAKAETPAPAAAAAPAPAAATATDVEDAPAAKKLMAEAGLADGQVTGTGRDGRVMKEDVLKAVAVVAAAPAPAPAVTPRAPVSMDE
ncbi:MAG: biotin/lipoyl-containing protein, partial [Paracoccaceae bacterium]